MYSGLPTSGCVFLDCNRELDVDIRHQSRNKTTINEVTTCHFPEIDIVYAYSMHKSKYDGYCYLRTKRVPLVEIMERRITNTADLYCDTLNRQIHIMRNKPGVILVHDNVRSHTNETFKVFDGNC